MVALPDMKTAQVMARDSILAAQLNIRPPVATAYELDRPVNLNPNAVNPKMIDPGTGRPFTIVPYGTGSAVASILINPKARRSSSG